MIVRGKDIHGEGDWDSLQNGPCKTNGGPNHVEMGKCGNDEQEGTCSHTKGSANDKVTRGTHNGLGPNTTLEKLRETKQKIKKPTSQL